MGIQYFRGYKISYDTGKSSDCAFAKDLVCETDLTTSYSALGAEYAVQRSNTLQLSTEKRC